jgi:transcriptional regulator with XRE-family HTH domain
VNLATPKSVRKLQRALYAKAKANPAYRFYTLYDKIYRKDVLQEAWSRCRANDGSSGVDGQSFTGIESKGVEAWDRMSNMNATNEQSRAEAFGAYLKSVRIGLQMSLRDVEQATDKNVSNAYLSQLETGKIAKPSPHILHSLAAIYQISYERLMERAGYISPTSSSTSKAKHGRLATYSIDHLTAEEEKELLDYLSYYRAKKKHRAKGG